MTQEDKELLLKELCERLPYGVNCVFHSKKGDIPATLVAVDYYRGIVHIKPIKQSVVYCYFVEDDYNHIPKPYLRPMDSMTDEEKDYSLQHGANLLYIGVKDMDEYITWLNSHHFDYRDLIKKGLALEAPKDMYKL